MIGYIAAIAFANDNSFIVCITFNAKVSASEIFNHHSSTGEILLSLTTNTSNTSNMNTDNDNIIEIRSEVFNTDFDDVDFEPHQIDDSDTDAANLYGYNK